MLRCYGRQEELSVHELRIRSVQCRSVLSSSPSSVPTHPEHCGDRILTSYIGKSTHPRKVSDIILIHGRRSTIQVCSTTHQKPEKSTRMQPKALLLAGLALVNTVTADKVLTTWSCPKIGSGCHGSGEWINDSGTHYWINADDGCRDIDVPSIKQVCFDWKGNRGHFVTDWNERRCLLKNGQEYNGDCADSRYTCIRQWWTQTNCVW
jgi:hypothetical protein